MTILFYNYVAITDPQVVMQSQRDVCMHNKLTGRIIIANEGINATLEGSNEAIAVYLDYLTRDERFVNTHIKKSYSNGTSFNELSVKVRNEIVSTHLGEQDIDPTVRTGVYITAQELHAWIHSNKEFYIVDMRNDYEQAVGRFKNSLLAKMSHFRELPSSMEGTMHLTGKTIVTVCTGGVRCEKASGYLLEQGFADVYQLYGGIVTYMEAYPNQDFQGQLYVFDNRITMGFNLDDENRVIVGECELCGVACEHYVNCANTDCHRHFIACSSCAPDVTKVFCPNQPCLAVADLANV